MASNRRQFMELTGLAALGGLASTAGGRSLRSGAGVPQQSAPSGDLPLPTRADQPTEPVQNLLDTLAEQNAPHISELSTEGARALYQNFFVEDADPQPVGNVENRTVPGPNGDVPIRIYTPEQTEFSDPLPVSIYMHGGGWVLGDLDTHDSVARSLTNASEGMLVAIDYRKAPENKFPAAVEDCWAVVEWVAENAASIGADPDRMAVTGESAGGDMTAVMTFIAQQHDSVGFVHQLPIYPVTDLTGRWIGELPDTFSILAPDAEQQLDRRYLVPADLPWFASRYLPNGIAANNIYTSPLLANGSVVLEDLPPATVVTTGFGPLGDQGYLYAQQLHEAGVDVSITHYPGMIHDFFNMEFLNDPYPDIPTAKTAKQRVGETLRAAFSATNETGGAGDGSSGSDGGGKAKQGGDETADGGNGKAKMADPESGEGQLVVAGLNADADGDDAANLNDEFITYRNAGDAALDLTGWTVQDEAGNTYTFPDGVTLSPDAEVTLYTGSGTNTATELYWGQANEVWNNGADTMTVRNASGTIVLQRSYP